uniref:COP9 signalosome complex subunit 4 n=1 Tax=Blastobotrys adeninivorans TaxID=409370 RepID=A0A060SYI8_BLAAD
MEDRIERITEQSGIDAETRINQYTELLGSINPEDGESLSRFASKMLSIAYGRTTAKPVINALLDYVESKSPMATQVGVLERLVEELQPVLASFEEQEMKARELLAVCFQNQEEYGRAAQVLQEGLNIGGRRLLGDGKRFSILVQIVRLYLETGQTERAEVPLSRAAILRPKVEKLDPAIDIHFRLSQARILDANRKFLEASAKYHAISRESVILEDDRMACLTQAIVCGVLSPAGPARTQNLHRLHSDDRSRQLPLFGLLEKAYYDRLLLPADVEAFKKYLSPHHLAIGHDGATILSSAVAEHNVQSMSKLYRNISIKDLGNILGLPDVAKAEGYAAKMISQNRLAGKINQVEGIIYFRSVLDEEDGTDPHGQDEEEGKDPIVRTKLLYDYANGDLYGRGGGEVVLREWGNNLHDLCNELEQLASDITASGFKA